jgi:hypothetical protein
MDRGRSKILHEWLVVHAQAGASAAQLVERWTPKFHRHAERLLRTREGAADSR